MGDKQKQHRQTHKPEKKHKHSKKYKQQVNNINQQKIIQGSKRKQTQTIINIRGHKQKTNANKHTQTKKTTTYEQTTSTNHQKRMSR